MSDHVILVGRREDGGHRDRLWQFCRDRWAEQLPDWRIVEGHFDDPGPFCLSVASNRAAALAGDWTVALYVGADWLVRDPAQVHAAADLAERTGQLVFAHNHTVVLSADATDRLLNGAQFEEVEQDGSQHTNTFSGALCVTRELWDAVGGFDERYRQWGFDDLGFWDACNALGGGFERVPGTIAHLYHPQVWEEREGNPHHGINQVLWERYRAVRSDARGMVALLSEPGGPLSG